MKHLKDYKETIHKCSKCGLCQGVCPIYLETKNECAVSRGQFIMLQGVIKGELKLNRTINKYLDYCLKCNKCSKFCPSGINIVEVILSAKAEYFKNSFEGKLLSFLESKFVFNNILKILKCLFGRQKKFDKKFDKKAIYFGGCVENVFPKTSEYIKSLLNLMEIEVVNIDFNCCGLPFLTSGNLPRFIEQVNENINKINDIKFDYFVTDCVSCEWAWKEYINYIDDDKLKNKLSKINFISIYDLLGKNNLKFVSKNLKDITYHTPCHGSSEYILKNIENINYIEMEEKESCCGFSILPKIKVFGLFSKFKNKKINNIFKTNVDIILTNCIGCMIALNIMLLRRKKVLRIVDFLRKYCDVKK